MELLQAALGERYELGAEVGRGASALVYRALDRRFGRPVAIKMLRPELGATLSAERFLLEIETAARLQHPHILPIYDAGEQGALLYFVMPLVDGESLRDRLAREGAMSWDDALRLVEQVSSALAYAHGQGVLHRDVKPENILLYQGHAMVADFGIAKVVASAESTITMPGSGVGTPVYMSPEQAFGDSDIDGRADQYSLACVLFEMLEGRPPFTGETLMAILAQKSGGATRPLQQARDRVPRHVDEALQRAMSHEPAARYDTMREFTRALSALSPRSAPSAASPAAAPGASPPAQGARDSAREAAQEPRRIAPASIAVLPFANIGADRDDEFLSDGLTEELIHALAGIHGLRVVGRTSAFAFKGRSVDAREAGAALGVSTVLDGSVRRSGTRLRLVAHLIDVETGFELWSERFDCSFTDVFDMQDDITRAIVGRLRVQLLGNAGRFVGAPTQRMDAYQAYLRGRFEWNQRTAQGLQRARGYLEEAVALDPLFALAHTALADCFVTLAVYGVLAPDDAMQAAQTSASTALALQPGMAEALTAQASVRALHHHDWDGAEALFRSAVIAAPSYPTTHHWRAMHAMVPRGLLEDAGVSLARALALDPLSPAVETSLGLLHHYRRDHGAAVAAFDALLVRHPQFTLALQFRGVALAAMGRSSEAIASLEELVARSQGHPEIVAALGVAYGQSGDVDRARAGLARLDQAAGARYISPVLAAQLLASVGALDEALDRLEAAMAVRAVDLPLITVRPVFDAMRSHPRFERLVAALHLSR
jgi:serine/threonine-protein kinase